MPVRACAILGAKAVKKRLVGFPARYAEGVKEETGRRGSVHIGTPAAREVPQAFQSRET